MIKVIKTNPTTKAEELVSRNIPCPLYDLGMNVMFFPDNAKTEADLQQGVITNIEINSGISSRNTLLVSVIYEIDHGLYIVSEEDILNDLGYVIKDIA